MSGRAPLGGLGVLKDEGLDTLKGLGSEELKISECQPHFDVCYI